jgi:hypothetical protein
MKLRVYYHSIDNLPGWQEIFEEKLNKVISSGLIDHCEIYINCHYNYSSYDCLKEKYPYNNIKWIQSLADPKEYEHPTYILMQQHALNSTEDYYALYLHSKGISHTGTSMETKTKYWRWYMDYFNIERWRDCVEILDSNNYDTCGVQRAGRTDNLPTFYEGNQCWYTSSFLRNAKPLKLPSQVGYVAQYDIPHPMYRSDVELWAWYNNDRWYSLHHSGTNLYCEEYSPDNYTGK